MKGKRDLAAVVSEQVADAAESYVDCDSRIAEKRREFYGHAKKIGKSLKECGGHEEDVMEVQAMEDCCCELEVLVLDAVCRMLADPEKALEILVGLKCKIPKEQYGYLQALFWQCEPIQPGEQWADTRAAHRK